MTIGIIGLGLIGGSMALDLRKKKNYIVGYDVNTAHARQAKQLKLVDSTVRDWKKLREVDVIIVSIPVNELVRFLPKLLDEISERTTLMDVGSTKHNVCEAVKNHPKRKQYVAAHPIAGTEFSGPAAAIPNLFFGKKNIICERALSGKKDVLKIEKIFSQLGMTTFYLSSDEHDKHMAYVSHLSHVISFMLGQTVLDIEKNKKNIFDLAGSGFASTARLAKSSPTMWTPIFQQNAHYLGQALQEYIIHLQKFLHNLTTQNEKAIHQALVRANELKRVLNKK